MEGDETKAKAQDVESIQVAALAKFLAPPDLPDDVDDMDSEDWTELNAWVRRVLEADPDHVDKAARETAAQIRKLAQAAYALDSIPPRSEG